MQESKTKKEQYNQEPVHYCTHCLSLRVRTVFGEDMDYCDSCGSTNIEQTQIEAWEDKYKKMYGINYLTKY